MKSPSSLVLATLALAAWVGNASAAPAPVYSWTGFYVGAQAGYGKAVNTERIGNRSTWWAAGAESAVYGAFAGYNMALAGNQIIGGEIEANGSRFVGQYFNSYYGGDYYDSSWSAAARIRYGVLTSPNAFLYGSAGIAVSNFDYSNGYFGSYAFTNANLAAVGVQFGVGIETFLAPRWSLRGEAVYSVYGVDSITYSAGPYRIDPTTLVARVGISYHGGSNGLASGSVPDAPLGSWTGFYFGGDFGMVAVDSIEDYAPPYSYDPSFDASGTAGRLGAHAGFNWQMGSVVAGLEADVQGPGPAFSYDESPEGKLDWSAAVRARLGFLTSPNVLVYATAGWAQSSFDYQANFLTDYVDHGAAKFTANGWQVGGGLETFVRPNFSVRVEGLYTGYPQQTLASHNGNPDYWLVTPHTFETRVGLTYHLN